MPGIPAENYWFRRHEAAYDAVVPFCPGAVVLEAGCGEGYGADRIAEVARVVLGLRLRRGRGRARGRGVPAGGAGAGQPRRAAGTRRRRGRGGHAAGDRAPVGPARLPGRVPPGAPAGRHAAGHHAEPADVLAAEPADEPVPLPRARPGRAGRAAGGVRLRDQPAARAAARAAAAPVRPPVRLAGGRAAGRAAGDLAPGAAPGGRPRSGRPTSCSARTTSTPASTWSRRRPPTCADRGRATPRDASRSTRARSDGERERPVGTFCLVLHTHLPWVAHAGAWPVGEEWLHQAFTGSWRRVFALLDRLAASGARDVLTLGVTPVLAAMLDDPYCLRELHTWAGNWQLRAVEAGRRGWSRSCAGYAVPRAAATECLADLEDRWLTGGLSAVLRPLVDAGVVELLGGPATHPFLPLLEPRVAAGRARGRAGRRPAAAGPGAGRDLGAGVRVRARPGGPVRGRRGGALRGRLPRAARRHRRGPAGRRPARCSASAATSRSPTGSGHRGPATRARRTTATSTPSTTPPASARPG